MSKSIKLTASLAVLFAVLAIGPALAAPEPAAIITSRIAGVKVGAPQTYGGLTVFPLTAKNVGGLNYFTLDEAMTDKLIEVSEVGDGDVNQVHIRSKSGKRVFIMDGEEIIGAKQNRILNTSVLIGAEKTVKTPVSCVEQGRWTGTSKNFKSGNTQLFAKARQANVAAVNSNYAARPSAGAQSNQSEVWDMVAEKRDALSISSSSTAMHEAYDKNDGKIAAYTKHFRTVSGQVGALFVIRGKIVGADIFDQNRTFKRLFPKMIKSYALDAIEKSSASETPNVDRADAQAFLKLALAKGVKFQDHDSPGEGRDVRIDSAKVAGASLVAGGRPLHIVLFTPAKKAAKPSINRAPNANYAPNQQNGP